MEINFAKYYRKAGIVCNAETISKRELVVSQLLDDVGKEDVYNLVKLFFQDKCENDYTNYFVQAFQQEDNLFAEDQTIEISVLAGIVLLELINSDQQEIKRSIEIFTYSALFIGKEPIIREICDVIIANLSMRARDNYENMNFDGQPLKGVSVEKMEIEDDSTVVFDVEVVQKINSVISNMKTLFNCTKKLQDDLLQKQQLLHEETQIMWWLLSEYSDDEGKKYIDIDTCNAAILIGKDIAALIQVEPGPYSIKSVMHHVISKFADQEEKRFVSYIDCCKDETITKLLNEEIPRTPILFALAMKKKVGAGNWEKAFNDKFSVEECNKKHSHIEIAYQMYLECILRQFDK